MQYQQYQFFMSFVTGLAGWCFFWIVLYLATGKHPWSLTMGEDKRPSTSKFQMLVWTGAVVFAYLAIYQIRFSQHHPEGLPAIPQNLLIAMGISAATTVSAKAIAVSNDKAAKTKVAAALLAGLPLPPPKSSLSGIFEDDDGSPDLGKVQVVLWTLIAVGVFLSGVFVEMYSPNTCVVGKECATTIPDIGQTLMVLMGLGHAAYIGNKIAQS
jgi:hypothetical protein